jgi:hypothetical protein
LIVSGKNKIECRKMELEKHGNFADEINAGFKKTNSPFRVKKGTSAIKHKNKFSQVYTTIDNSYTFDFWRDGVCLAHGQTRSINELVSVIDFWLLNDISTSELALTYLFVSPNEQAAAFDENREVEFAWNRYLNSEYSGELKEFLTIAKEDEIVGKLFPFTSLTTLCFSRCTGYPYTSDTPMVIPVPYEESKYEVRSPDNSIIGRGNAKAALKMVKENLPFDISPAVKGTVDDL